MDCVKKGFLKMKKVKEDEFYSITRAGKEKQGLKDKERCKKKVNGNNTQRRSKRLKDDTPPEVTVPKILLSLSPSVEEVVEEVVEEPALPCIADFDNSDSETEMDEWKNNLDSFLNDDSHDSPATAQAVAPTEHVPLKDLLPRAESKLEDFSDFDVISTDVELTDIEPTLNSITPALVQNNFSPISSNPAFTQSIPTLLSSTTDPIQSKSNITSSTLCIPAATTLTNVLCSSSVSQCNKASDFPATTSLSLISTNTLMASQITSTSKQTFSTADDITPNTNDISLLADITPICPTSTIYSIPKDILSSPPATVSTANSTLTSCTSSSSTFPTMSTIKEGSGATTPEHIVKSVCNQLSLSQCTNLVNKPLSFETSTIRQKENTPRASMTNTSNFVEPPLKQAIQNQDSGMHQDIGSIAGASPGLAINLEPENHMNSFKNKTPRKEICSILTNLVKDNKSLNVDEPKPNSQTKVNLESLHKVTDTSHSLATSNESQPMARSKCNSSPSILQNDQMDHALDLKKLEDKTINREKVQNKSEKEVLLTLSEKGLEKSVLLTSATEDRSSGTNSAVLNIITKQEGLYILLHSFIFGITFF